MSPSSKHQQMKRNLREVPVSFLERTPCTPFLVPLRGVDAFAKKPYGHCTDPSLHASLSAALPSYVENFLHALARSLISRNNLFSSERTGTGIPFRGPMAPGCLFGKNAGEGEAELPDLPLTPTASGGGASLQHPTHNTERNDPMTTPDELLPEAQEVDQATPLLLDPEALLLCGLMWAGPSSRDADRVCDLLEHNDFYHPHHGTIFTLLASRRQSGLTTDPASIRSGLAEQGSKNPLPHRTAERLLIEIATLGVTPEQILSYADQVLGASYRRQYQAMTQALANAAETAPENELFPVMVHHGQRQRAAWERRQALYPRPEPTREAQ